MRILIVLGTRPEIMKNYSVVRALRKFKVPFRVAHTNQHSDFNMCGAFFKQMAYEPDYVLEQYSLGKAIDWVRDIIRRERIDFLLINGDTAAALVGAVAGKYSDIGVGHIESGLRSFDREMYEERNRMVADSIAQYLFTYTRVQADYLSKNKELRGRIFNVGNTTVDLIHDFADRIVRPTEQNYIYVTLHRKEFTDHKERMVRVFRCLDEITRRNDIDVVFPIHPRTVDCAKRHGIRIERIFGSRVKVIPPVPAFTSLGYEKHARLIFTDSGCIQEEACIFRVPCVTVRENTERHETIKLGVNVVTGFDRNTILASVDRFLRRKPAFRNPYGNYGVGNRIVQTILRNYVDFRHY